MTVHVEPDSFLLEDYLAAHERKSLLRFITCGSVDDGKSTLIGRLLYESKRLFDDQLATLERDSRKHGTQGGGIDFALWWMGSPANASRASPSMSPIAFSRPTGGPSSSPTHPAMSNTRGTWQRVHPRPMLPSSSSMRARASRARPADMRFSCPCSGSAMLPWRSTRWTSWMVRGEIQTDQCGVPSLCGQSGLRSDRGHSAVGSQRRQRRRAIVTSILVRRPDAALLSRNCRGRAEGRR